MQPVSFTPTTPAISSVLRALEADAVRLIGSDQPEALRLAFLASELRVGRGWRDYLTGRRA